MAICGSASVRIGPILLTQRAVAPAADRQQIPGQAEQELDQRRDDEGRDGAAGGRGGDDGIVAELVLVERGDDAERAADAAARAISADGAELDRDRQAVGEQFADGEVGQIVARPEIAVQQVVRDSCRYCSQSGSFEAELRLQIGLDLRAEAPLLVERAAGRDADQEERQRDDDEQRRDGRQQPPDDIASACAHASLSKRRPPLPDAERRSRRSVYSLLMKRDRMDVHHVVFEALELRRNDVVEAVVEQRNVADFVDKHALGLATAASCAPPDCRRRRRPCPSAPRTSGCCSSSSCCRSPCARCRGRSPDPCSRRSSRRAPRR